MGLVLRRSRMVSITAMKSSCIAFWKSRRVALTVSSSPVSTSVRSIACLWLYPSRPTGLLGLAAAQGAEPGSRLRAVRERRTSR